MTDLQTAAQQALEVLRHAVGELSRVGNVSAIVPCVDSIKSLEAALAQQEQEFSPAEIARMNEAWLHRRAAGMAQQEQPTTITFGEIRAAMAQQEQAVRDALTTGTGVLLGGERIDPASVYKQQEQEQEPVAWLLTGGTDVYLASEFSPGSEHEHEWTPLYTHPPRREWRGLTDDELGELMHDSCGYPMCPNGDDLAFARAVEQALKERNNG